MRFNFIWDRNVPVVEARLLVQARQRAVVVPGDFVLRPLYARVETQEEPAARRRVRIV